MIERDFRHTTIVLVDFSLLFTVTVIYSDFHLIVMPISVEVSFSQHLMLSNVLPLLVAKDWTDGCICGV